MVLVEDHLQFLETNSTSGISQTSYAPSIFTSNESFPVPNPPKESADESPFECPYCCLVIKIKGKKDWARHVFRDLMPYVCISAECSTPSKLYESRRQWYDHMRQSHSTLANLQSGSNCPLCQVPLYPPLTFDRHVGHHMEQLALFVLPRPTPSEENASGTASNVASLGAFGDGTTRSTDSIKEVSQTGSSTLPYVSPREYDGFNIPPIQHRVGNSELETLSTSPNFESPTQDHFPLESSEKAKKENSYPSYLDCDLGSSFLPNEANTWTTIAEASSLTSNESLTEWPPSPQKEFTRTTLHESNHINDSEDGLPSHDGKKKADDDTGLLRCNWKDCESKGVVFSSKGALMRHTETQHIASRSFICPVCGKGFGRSNKMNIHLLKVHLVRHSESGLVPNN